MLYNIRAINLRNTEDVNHDGFEDSRIAKKLAILGIFFFPLAIASFVISKEAKESEKDNIYLKKANKISTILVGIILGVIVVSFFITARLLGINELV